MFRQERSHHGCLRHSFHDLHTRWKVWSSSVTLLSWPHKFVVRYRPSPFALESFGACVVNSEKAQSSRGIIPIWACFVADMIKSQVVHDPRIPIMWEKFIRNMASHIVVNFGEILLLFLSSLTLHKKLPFALTETKKLDVPSARLNVWGNNFSQVSSPYMINLPPFASICASHVSWFAKLDVVSDSAKLSITSRKDGMEPVVIALIRGIVIVGGVAWAVNGMASPVRINSCVNVKPDFSVYTKSLLSASTTMNMTLSNWAFGGGPCSKLLYWASPWMKGL